MDPWGNNTEKSAVADPKFEDDFSPESSFAKLSDSAEYLAALGKIFHLIIPVL